MADLTARLIWYRLGECYRNVGEKIERFQEWWADDFSVRRVDLLDMLFLGWLVAAFLVVGAINLYLRFFGLPKNKRRGNEAHPAATVKGGESVEWINSALSWLYLHYNSTPELIENWLRALNEQARKHPCEYQVKFDRVQAGSVPPKFTQVTTDVSNNENLTLRAGIECTELSLLVSAIQQSPTNIKVCNCDVNIAKLHGQLKIHSQYGSEDIQTTVQFVEPPNLQLTVKARNYDSNLNIKSIEDVIRMALAETATSFTLPSKGGFPNFYGGPPGARAGEYGKESQIMPSRVAKTSAAPSLLSSSNLSRGSGSSSLKDKRLLVKVIKANGLGDKDFGCSDPYCIVEMDAPAQKHTTSVVKNTVNPFWDEHFLFELDDVTGQVKFEVFDREKAPGDDFLGRAVIQMSELRRLPSSRQIIPLTGKPGSSTSGSVTIEFLFMEPADSDGDGTMGPGGLSPRRRIETSQRMMPGGVNITTTTTTTEKPRDYRENAGYNGSPSRVEKSDGGYGAGGDYSPYSRSSSSHLGAHEAGMSLSSSQGGGIGGRNTSAGSPMLTLTPSTPTPGAGGQQYSQMTESSPTDHELDQQVMSPDQKAEMKKSRSFASTLKRRFQRGGGKKSRSQSADRASSSLREGSLLRPPPPEQQYRNSQTDEFGRVEIPEDGLRKKQRSSSFSNSLKKLFHKKKKDGGPGGLESRESSVSRVSTRSHTGVIIPDSPSQMATRGGGGTSGLGDYRSGEPGYSSSVPAHTSPLYDQYNTH